MPPLTAAAFLTERSLTLVLDFDFGLTVFFATIWWAS